MACGVDVSGWQSVDGAEYGLASGYGSEFAIVKLSQGEKRSKKGMRHVSKALPTGLPVGAYHFASPLRRGLRSWRPLQQAEAFCDAVQDSGLLYHNWPFDIPRLWLDMEWISFGKTKDGKARGKAFRRQFTPSEVMRWTRAFVAHVHNRLGVRCGIYTGRSYIKYRFGSDPVLRFFDLWLASYVDVGPSRTDIPTRRPKPVELGDDRAWRPCLWQFTGKGSVPWYRRGKGKIDRNLILPVEGEAA